MTFSKAVSVLVFRAFEHEKEARIWALEDRITQKYDEFILEAKELYSKHRVLHKLKLNDITISDIILTLDKSRDNEIELEKNHIFSTIENEKKRYLDLIKKVQLSWKQEDNTREIERVILKLLRGDSSYKLINTMLCIAKGASLYEISFERVSSIGEKTFRIDMEEKFASYQQFGNVFCGEYTLTFYEKLTINNDSTKQLIVCICG